MMFDFSANAVSKCNPFGVQGGKTGTQVPHGVQNDKCECSAGAVARLTSYLFRSDVLPCAQLSIDTHRSVQDETGAEARMSLTATQRLPDSSTILLRKMLLLTAILSWIATFITAERPHFAECLTNASTCQQPLLAAFVSTSHICEGCDPLAMVPLKDSGIYDTPYASGKRCVRHVQAPNVRMCTIRINKVQSS